MTQPDIDSTSAGLIERVRTTPHGFTDIRAAATDIREQYKIEDRLQIALALFGSQVEQARMLATFLWGDCAAGRLESLTILRQIVSRDPDWRLQEILAQAFDTYCRDNGYEQSLAVSRGWLVDPHPNVRRAVTEGLRIRTTRPYFKQHPEVAIRWLSDLRADHSEYVRRSVGNALCDISRKHGDLISAELTT
ncbi:MAG: HEAT repeat domain-containing protein [Anaerolineae bacterium]